MLLLDEFYRPPCISLVSVFCGIWCRATKSSITTTM
ncbi:hypothetical protein MJ581_22225 [Escherichia coli]|nr:hypothetical protein MJ581_22225 [Escherichia coli]